MKKNDALQFDGEEDKAQHGFTDWFLPMYLIAFSVYLYAGGGDKILERRLIQTKDQGRHSADQDELSKKNNG